jgi:tetratricopeptide (TPR) repeat protein
MTHKIDKRVMATAGAFLAAATLSFVWTPATIDYPAADFELGLRESYKWFGRKNWERSRKFSAQSAISLKQLESANAFLAQSSRVQSFAQAKAQMLSSMGWADWKANHNKISASFFRQATELFPDPAAHLGMAEVHKERSNSELALLHLAAVRRSKINNFLNQEFTYAHSMLEASKIKSDLDQPLDACLFALRARMTSPGNVATYIQLATCLDQLDLRTAALDVLQMPRSLKDPNAIILRAELIAKNGRYFDALKTLDEIFPPKTLQNYTTSDIAALRARGTIESARNNHKSAQRWFEAALLLAPQDLDIRLNAAWSINKQRNFIEASHHFETVLESDPTNSSALLGLGEAYFELGRFLESEQILRLLIANPPGTITARKHFIGWAHFWLGRLFEIRSDIASALGEFEKALSHKPTNIPARVHIANLLLNHQSCEDAIPHWIEIRLIQTGRGSHDDIIKKCEAKL